MEAMGGSGTRNNKPGKQYRSRRKKTPKHISIGRFFASGLYSKNRRAEKAGSRRQGSRVQSPELLAAAVMVGVLVITAIVSRNIRNRNDHTEAALPAFVSEDLLVLNKFTRPGILNPGIRQVVFIPYKDADQTAAQIKAGFIKAGSEGVYESSHFAIGSDGSALCCVPLDEMACGRYAGSPGTVSVTFSPDSDHDDVIPDDEYETMVELGRWLKDRFTLTSEDFVSSDETVLISSGLASEAGDDFWAKYREEIGK
jgi:hypothetical protein